MEGETEIESRRRRSKQVHNELWAALGESSGLLVGVAKESELRKKKLTIELRTKRAQLRELKEATNGRHAREKRGLSQDTPKEQDLVCCFCGEDSTLAAVLLICEGCASFAFHRICGAANGCCALPHDQTNIRACIRLLWQDPAAVNHASGRTPHRRSVRRLRSREAGGVERSDEHSENSKLSPEAKRHRAERGEADGDLGDALTPQRVVFPQHRRCRHLQCHPHRQLLRCGDVR